MTYPPTVIDTWLKAQPPWLQRVVVLALLFGPALGVMLMEAAFAAVGR